MTDTLTVFTDSPDTGPDCICSYCGNPILTFAIRGFMTDENAELRFHVDCYKIVTTRGLGTFELRRNEE